MEALNKKTEPEPPEADLAALTGQALESASLIVMLICGECFAVEIDKVQEVIRVPRMTWLPGSPPYIRGLINLRGSILAVADMAVLLDHPPLQIGPQDRIVVVEASAATLGLLVEEVTGVENPPATSLEQSLRTLNERLREIIVAQVGLKGKLAGVLDIDKLVEKARFTSVMSNNSGQGQSLQPGGKNGN